MSAFIDILSLIALLDKLGMMLTTRSLTARDAMRCIRYGPLGPFGPLGAFGALPNRFVGTTKSSPEVSYDPSAEGLYLQCAVFMLTVAPICLGLDLTEIVLEQLVRGRP